MTPRYLGPLLLAGLLSGCSGDPAAPLPTDGESESVPRTTPDGARRSSLTIEGMVCQSCAEAAERTIEDVTGVFSAEADFARGTAEVVFDPEQTSLDAVARRLETVDRRSAPPFRVVAPDRSSKRPD